MPEINTGKKIKRIEFGLVLSKEGKKTNNSKLALQKAMLNLVNKESSVVEEKILSNKEKDVKLTARRLLRDRSTAIEEQNYKGATLYWNRDFPENHTYAAYPCCENTQCNLVPNTEGYGQCENCVRNKKTMFHQGGKYNGENCAEEDKKLSFVI